MATEVLVNDGGAPCRIIPMIVKTADVTAGDALASEEVGAGLDAKCQPLNTSLTEKIFIGVALTDAAIGEVCNVITGRGVVCMINCTDVNAGIVMMGGTAAGRLTALTGTYTGLSVSSAALTLENNGAVGLTKCLIV